MSVRAGLGRAALSSPKRSHPPGLRAGLCPRRPGPGGRSWTLRVEWGWGRALRHAGGARKCTCARTGGGSRRSTTQATTCKKIRGIPDVTPHVDCQNPSNESKIHPTVANHGFSTNIKLFSTPPLLTP